MPTTTNHPPIPDAVPTLAEITTLGARLRALAPLSTPSDTRAVVLAERAALITRIQATGQHSGDAA